MGKGSAPWLAFGPKDGIVVFCTARVTPYPGRSKYQCVIETMELAGEGALMALFEKLKAQLDAEGLFEKSRARRPLPFLPKVIGVVTSPRSAERRDGKECVSTC